MGGISFFVGCYKVPLLHLYDPIYHSFQHTVQQFKKWLRNGFELKNQLLISQMEITDKRISKKKTLIVFIYTIISGFILFALPNVFFGVTKINGGFQA